MKNVVVQGVGAEVVVVVVWRVVSVGVGVG